MTVHDAQTLMALRRYERRRDLGDADGPTCSDMTVVITGARLFDEGWTPVKQGRYNYAPLVSMSLGRLRRLDLVRKTKVNEVANYHHWGLTGEGRLEADRLLGEAR